MADSIVKGSFYLTLATAFYLAANYVVYFLLSRSFTPAEFGVYGIVTTLVSTVGMLLASSIEPAASKFASETNASVGKVSRAVFSLTLKISFALFAVVFLLADFIALAFNDSSLATPIRLASLFIVFAPLFSSGTGLLSGTRHFLKQSASITAYSIIRVLLIIGFVLLGFSVLGALAGVVLSVMAISVIVWLLNKPAFEKAGTSQLQKRVLPFLLPLMLLALLTNFLTNFDLFAVKALSAPGVSSINAGFYAAASLLSKIPLLLISAVSIVVIPVISRQGFARLENTQKIIRTTMRYSLMILAPIVLALAFTSQEVIQLFYSAKFLPAAEPFTILVLGIGLFSLATVAFNIMIALGRPKIPTIITLFSLIIAVALSIALVPLISMRGAAIATAVAGAFAFACAAFYLIFRLKALMSWISLARIAIAACLTAFALGFWQVGGLLLVLKYLAFLILYCFLLVALKEFKKEDWNFFLGIVK
ncbi:MAG: oligosaccharide flippase family protein [Candidatus Diapherotrites archaeon]|nr:oligosaccharide flippase family protein [Candidatus Diapherotrites archaeon]